MRGVSPFIATIILVVVTIAIGVVVYSILSSYIRGAGTGGGRSAEKTRWIILNDNSYIFVGNVSSSTDFGSCNTCSKITELQINITGFGEKVKGVKVQDLKCGIFTEAFI